MADDYLLNPDLTPSSDSDDVRRAPGNGVRLDPPLTPLSSCPGCGCMDNGNMPNTYQNNFGTLGSLTPPYPAYNYDPGATTDDGSCRYTEVWNACGCNDPSSVNFIGDLYQNGYGMPGTGVSWSPDWNLHPGFFTDCAGNVRGSQQYLAVGPHGDTSCCEKYNDGLYNYRDTFMASRTFGPTQGRYRGIGVDGGCGSGGNKANMMSSDFMMDSVIGLPFFTISPNLKDVHGNIFELSDFHTSNSGWTIQIYDLFKEYLGTWHYDECLSHTILPVSYGQGSDGQFIKQSSNTPIGQTLESNIKLVLHGVTHLDGPNPVINYGNNIWQYSNTGVNRQQWAMDHVYGAGSQIALGSVVQKSKVPEYLAGSTPGGTAYTGQSVSFAYIKITVDKNRKFGCGQGVTQYTSPPPQSSTYPGADISILQQQGRGHLINNPNREWFENIYTGPNTNINKMNVVCLACAPYRHSHTDSFLQQPGTFDEVQWATGMIGTPCCDNTSESYDGNVAHPSIIGSLIAASDIPWWHRTATGCNPSLHGNPYYNYRVFSHWLHPWPATHKVMPLNSQWYENLSIGYPNCRVNTANHPFPGNCQT